MAAKREPRAVTIGEIERMFELASYWFGSKWCPAVHRTARGYGIRIVRSQTIGLTSQQITYDYFELDENGVITTAPRGHAKDFKPGQVADIETWVGRYATPISTTSSSTRDGTGTPCRPARGRARISGATAPKSCGLTGR